MESYRRAVFGGLAGVARPQWLFLQFLLREHQERQAARAGGHHSDPLGGPPSSEFVPGYDAAAWIGVSAPKKTPPEIIDKLNKEVNAALADPKLKLQLADLGSSVAGGSAADYGRRLEEEAEKWGKVIRAANINAE